MVSFKVVRWWEKDSANATFFGKSPTYNYFLIKAILFNNFFSHQCNETTSRFSSFDICNDEIIRSMDRNKAHGHDGIFVPMLILWTLLISKPSSVLSSNERKKASTVTKGDKEFLEDNNLLNLHQSGFQPDDLCVH